MGEIRTVVAKTVPVEELVAHALTSLRDGRRTLRAAALTLLTCAVEDLRSEPGLNELALEIVDLEIHRRKGEG